MNKTAALLAALAAGATSGAVHAQTNVTIYGIVDAALVGESGGSAGHVTKVTSGAASASRIGFKGEESLGHDLSAFFILETGSKIDTGEVDAAGTIFNRQAVVGLKSKAYGALGLGRQYTPYHTMLAGVVDPFGTGYAGTSKNLFPDSGTNVRTSNTITYASPRVQGVDAQLAYSVGEQTVASAGRQFGGALGYANGPLTVRLAFNSRNADVAATGVSHDIGRNTLIGGNYNFGWIKVHAGYGIDKGYNASPPANANNPYGGVKPTPSTDARDVLLGFTAPLGRGTLMASVMHKDDRTHVNQDASSWGVGYLYGLSRRTGLYAAYGHIDNRNGAGYTVANNTESGTGNTGYNLGIRHTF